LIEAKKACELGDCKEVKFLQSIDGFFE
jgi:hypothetical protein